MRTWLIFLLKLYKGKISPLLGQRCRYYPSCSEYALSCLENYPFFRASLKIVWRICRCNPLNAGGVDLP